MALGWSAADAAAYAKKAKALQSIPSTTEAPKAPSTFYEPLSVGYIQRAATFSANSGIALDTSIEHLAQLNYGGRGENANPFYLPQIAQASFDLAATLGLTKQDAYDAAAHFANEHYNTFGQFYTEASAPEIIADGITQLLFAKAGRAASYVPLNAAQRTEASAKAQSVQDAFKLNEARDARLWNIGATETIGTFVASWFGDAGLYSKAGVLAANQLIGTPRAPEPLTPDQAIGGAVRAINSIYDTADAVPNVNFLSLGTEANPNTPQSVLTLENADNASTDNGSVLLYVALAGAFLLFFVALLRR